MLNATNSNAIISKSKNVLSISFCISGIYVIFRILSSKRWASDVILFWNYRLENAELLKCLKSLVSEHLWTIKMLKCLKDFLNLQGSIFVIFFDHSERKSASFTIIWNHRISEIIEYKKRGYLNALKAADQNTYGQSSC